MKPLFTSIMAVILLIVPIAISHPINMTNSESLTSASNAVADKIDDTDDGGLAGTSITSIEALKEYISTLNKQKDSGSTLFSEDEYLLQLNALYFPIGFTKKLDYIKDIFIAPSYLCITFNFDGVRYALYHTFAGGKSGLDSAQYRAELAGITDNVREINGSKVYSYFVGEGYPADVYRYTYHCWEQNGQYFTLRVGEKNADPNKRYFDLCHAEAYPLFDSFREFGFRTINGSPYYVQKDGTYATGWQKIDGKTYYFRKGGAALTKNTTINGIRCKFNQDGHFLGRFTGWLVKHGDARSTHHYYKNGVLQTGWLTLGGKTYYVGEDGVREVGYAVIDGKPYSFDRFGVLMD